MLKQVFIPYNNLMLAILSRAKEDTEAKKRKPNLMWAAFQRDFLKHGIISHPSPMAVAEWVMNFIQDYGIKDYCLSVKAGETAAEELRRLNKQNANL